MAATIVDDPHEGSIGSLLHLPEQLERLLFGQNVDMTPKEFLLHAEENYAERIDHHIQQYRATIYTIGLIAGVVGTDKQQTEIREAIKAAISQYGASLTERNQREHWYSDFDSPTDIFSTAWGIWEAVVGGVEKGIGAGIEATGDYFESEMVSNAGKYVDAVGSQTVDSGVSTIYTDYDGVIADAITDLWNSIVDSAVKWWNDFKKTVDSEGLVIALGQAHVDASFLIAEIAIDIGIGMLTAGWGGAAFRAIRIVGRRTIDSGTDIVIKLVREGADAIEVKRLHHADANIPGDVEKMIPDLEDLQGHPDVDGNTTPNVDKPETTSIEGNSPSEDMSGSKGQQIDDTTAPDRIDRAPDIERLDALLVDGKVPTIRRGFGEWFDNLSADDFDRMWSDTTPRFGRNNDQTIKDVVSARIRSPGGLHEWLPVKMTPELKRLGFSMDEIKEFRTLTSETHGINPVWRHGETGSPQAHNEIFDIIENSMDKDDVIRQINSWADYRLPNGRTDLPVNMQRW